MNVIANDMHFKSLNEMVRSSPDKEISIEYCNGQRYIAAGLANKNISIKGTAGNALGAYLDGSTIHLYGNAQDSTGDTMNDGKIVIHGSSGDAIGYAMRGGQIYVEGDTGYRAGIHMKAYKDKLPVLVIGGKAGSFLGEYQAGGIILVLGEGANGMQPTGDFCGTGMHGGKIYLRCDEKPKNLPEQVEVSQATQQDLEEIKPYVDEFCNFFDKKSDEILVNKFYILTPNTKSPYKRLYTYN